MNDMLGKPLQIGDKVLQIQLSGRSSFRRTKYYVVGFTDKLVIVSDKLSDIGKPSSYQSVKGTSRNMLKMPDDELGWPEQ